MKVFLYFFNFQAIYECLKFSQNIYNYKILVIRFKHFKKSNKGHSLNNSKLLIFYSRFALILQITELNGLI